MFYIQIYVVVGFFFFFTVKQSENRFQIEIKDITLNTGYQSVQFLFDLLCPWVVYYLVVEIRILEREKRQSRLEPQ